MPDYLALTDAYNTRKRNNGNWVIFLCISLLIISFAVIVFLSNMVVNRDNLVKNLKSKLPPGAYSDSALAIRPSNMSPILIQDSLKTIILQLRDSLQHLRLAAIPDEYPKRWANSVAVTLFESRLDDTITLPFTALKGRGVDAYALNIQFKNILGYSLNLGGAVSSNVAFKVSLNSATPLEDAGNYTLPIQLDAGDRDKLANNNTSPVYIHLKYSSYKGKGTLKIKLLPKWK